MRGIMKFRNSANGEIIEVERLIKQVKLLSVRGGYRYKHCDCDVFLFEDEDGERWEYRNTNSRNTSRSHTKIGDELAYDEGRELQLSAYYIKASEDTCGVIYRPRIIIKERVVF